MHEAFWNGLLDMRWEDAPLGPETTRLVLRLRECGQARQDIVQGSQPIRAERLVRTGVKPKPEEPGARSSGSKTYQRRKVM